MAAFPVVLDAYPLADLLLRLADEQTYRPLWSATILEETRRTMIEKLGLAQSKTDWRLDMMRESFIDAEVSGYEDLIPVMENDPKDRHVLAAAVREKAEVIVTFNLRHFPDAALKQYNIRALDPDEFLLDQIDLYPGETRKVLTDMVDDYDNPPLSLAELLEAMGNQGVPQFAELAGRRFTPT
jgi:predicted nucleic acid-binding protein